jgi:hypothetical protein
MAFNVSLEASFDNNRGFVSRLAEARSDETLCCLPNCCCSKNIKLIKY